MRLLFHLQIQTVIRIFKLLDLNAQNIFKSQEFKKVSSYLYNIATKQSVATADIYLSHLRSYRTYLSQQRSNFDVSLADLKALASRLNRVGKAKNSKQPRKSIGMTAIQKMKNASISDRAEAILDRAAITGKLMTPRPAVTVRDSLWLKILLSNCCRNGELCSLTVKEFNEAEEINGKFIILIHDHKTSFRYGPSRIILSRPVYEDMKKYLLYRPKTKGDVPEFFLNIKCERCKTDLVNHALNREYKEETDSSTRIRTTDLRMMATTAVHSTKGPKERHILARKLMHSLYTAEKSYKSATSSLEAIEGYELIAKVLNI